MISEVFAVYHNDTKNNRNRNLTRDFINSLGPADDEDGPIKKSKLEDIPKEKILDFIEKFEIPVFVENLNTLGMLEVYFQQNLGKHYQVGKLLLPMIMRNVNDEVALIK